VRNNKEFNLVSLFKRKVIHPILFAVYPVLALLAHNIEEIKITTGIRALVLTALASLVILFALRLVLKDWPRAGLLTSLILILFFSYGQVYAFLEQTPIFGINLGRHRFLLPALGLILILGTLWLLRSKRELWPANQSLNLISAFLVALPIFQLVIFGAQVIPALSTNQGPEADIGGLHLPQSQKPPDIYYIILDTYTRADIFDEIYEFNNKEFINQLREMGFYVAACSQSNYSQTRLSLASSLNMQYLDPYLKDFSTHSEEMANILPLTRHSAVRQALENLGYLTVSFETGHLPTQWEDTDYYLSPNAGLFSDAENLGRLSEFEVMLLKTSAGLLLTDAATGLPQRFGDVSHSYWQIYRDRILYTMDRLESVPTIPGPKFVFAHILAPHPPYVFGPDGNLVQEEKGKIIGYRDQVAYVNKRMVPLLQSLIANSEVPPIIILQGDHGVGSFTHHDRMAILNAYFLPNGGDQKLYEMISPVNSFRVVFNHYFGGDYPLLEDSSHYTISREPYQFELVPSEDDNCSQY
jgi:hypothetical protein